MSKAHYKKAGVDLDRADKLVRNLPLPHKVNASSQKMVQKDDTPNDFAAVLSLPEQFNQTKDGSLSPQLVSTTDGVGSKMLLARTREHHRAMGKDCVAMCTNDILAMGATPLWFMDYFGANALNEEMYHDVMTGVYEACQEEGCQLVGGETAEMPDFYNHDRYELVGFCMGVLTSAWNAPLVRGDHVIAFASNGIHSNGLSLIRHAAKEDVLNLSHILDGESVLDLLMKPTTQYGEALRALRTRSTSQIKRAAHVTGGGLWRAHTRLCHGSGLNVHRLMTDEQMITCEPQVLKHVRQALALSWEQGCEVWNMGIGFMCVLSGEEYEPDEILHITQGITDDTTLSCWYYGTLQ